MDIYAPVSPVEKREKPLAEKVWHFIQEHGLISPQETLLVGVSGGADSVCLLHILITLQSCLKAKLHIAHLNHLLRGAESQADAEYVSMLSQQLGVPATIEQREIHRTRHHSSREEAARETRYEFFAQVARSIGAKKVAVGHNAADQRETILMHLIRGAGAEGLSSMQPSASWRAPNAPTELIVIRPLLEIEREEIEKYCQENNLAPREDSSNVSLSYFRNRIRHQLLPLLQSYNPKLRETLLRTAHILAEQTAFLEEQTTLLWHRVVKEQPEMFILNIKEFFALHPALQRCLLRAVLRKILGDLRDIEWKHIESLRQAMRQPAGKTLSLPRGLTFLAQYDEGVITTNTARLYPISPLEGETKLTIPGETTLPGGKIVAIIQEVSAQFPDIGFPASLAQKAYLDLRATGKELWVRQRRPGDRFQPLGMKQPKKLQDFMVDAKIPRLWRDRIPLICSPEYIFWVVGWRISELVKVTDATQQILCLEFIPLFPSSASFS